MKGILKYWIYAIFLISGAGLTACSDEKEFDGYPDEEIPGESLQPAVTHIGMGFADTLLQVVKSDKRVELTVNLTESYKDTLFLKVKPGKTFNCQEGRDFRLEEECMIPAGQTKGTLVMYLEDDQKPGKDMQVSVELESFEKGNHAFQFQPERACRVVIASSSIVFFEHVEYEIWESGHVRPNALEIPLKIVGGVTAETTIHINGELQGGEQEEEAHFSLEKTSFTVQPGEESLMVRLYSIDDDVVNDDRTVLLCIAGIEGGNLVPARANTTCKIKIRNEEVVRTIRLDKTQCVVSENLEGGILEIPVKLDIPAEHELQVQLKTDVISGVEGTDFRLSTPSLVFAPGETESKICVEIMNDQKISAKRELVIKLDAANDRHLQFAETAKECKIEIQEDDYASLALVNKNYTFIEAQKAVISVPFVLSESYDDILQLGIRLAGHDPELTSLPDTTVIIPKQALESEKFTVKVNLNPEALSAPYYVDIVSINGIKLSQALRAVTLTPQACPYRKLIGDWDLTCVPDNCAAQTVVHVSAGNTHEERVANWNQKLVCVAEKLAQSSFDINFYIAWNNGAPQLMLLEKAYPDALNFGSFKNCTIRLTWTGDKVRQYYRHNLTWKESEGILDWNKGSNIAGAYYQNDENNVSGWWWFMKDTVMKKKK